MFYGDLLNALATLLQVPAAGDTNFQIILPRIIDDAEQRIYREMNFKFTRSTPATAQCIPGSRELTIPASVTVPIYGTGKFIVVENINILTPANNNNFAQCTRNPLEPVSLDLINMIYPTESQTGLPEKFCMKTQDVVIMAPAPDLNYYAELIGRFRPAPLTISNPFTYISITYPDLLVAACMVFATAYQRDFGEAPMDEKMASTWEVAYQTRKASAMAEEQRRA